MVANKRRKGNTPTTGDFYAFLASGKESKLISSYYVGKRDHNAGDDFMEDGCVQLLPSSFPAAFGLFAGPRSLRRNGGSHWLFLRCGSCAALGGARFPGADSGGDSAVQSSGRCDRTAGAGIGSTYQPSHRGKSPRARIRADKTLRAGRLVGETAIRQVFTCRCCWSAGARTPSAGPMTLQHCTPPPRANQKLLRFPWRTTMSSSFGSMNWASRCWGGFSRNSNTDRYAHGLQGSRAVSVCVS